MAFNPKQEYLITEDKILLKDFFDYREDYITRPAYQHRQVTLHGGLALWQLKTIKFSIK